ncbi:MAG: NAD(P)-dependent oxidoreductase [Candidatus Latescibacteria bacterium]|nr:NAD(P)-dependent oxidoreductase [Candidatus Latescibacterota bacterium]
MRIAITGSSGLIGTVLVEELHQRHEITGYDRTPPAALPQGIRFVQGDMEDRQTLAQALEGAEGVIHLAAIPYDIPPLHEVFRINMQGTYNALEIAVEQKISCLLFASSIMAYGFGQNADPQYFPIDEEHPVLANRPYGLSKRLGEELCRAFTERCGIRTHCFRLTTAVAPGKRYDLLPSKERQGEVGIFSYFDVRDFARLAEAALQATALTHEVFLVSAGDSGHADPTAEVISRYYPQARLRYEQLAPTSPFVTCAKARRLLGYAPRHSWRT